MAVARRLHDTGRRGGEAMSSTEALLERAPGARASATMPALVYHGPGRRAWEEKPAPRIMSPTDALVRVTTASICGTDLRILEGALPEVADGRVLGHEGVGVVEDVGPAVTAIRRGDRVLVSAITSCGACVPCRRGMYSQCADGGWALGRTIDGLQAEYVRVPHADRGLYRLPPRADESAMAMLSDLLPTGFECGVVAAQVKPGDTIAIVGAGPVGLAALMTAQLFSPAEIVMLDVDVKRLEAARLLGATTLLSSADGHAVDRVLALTGGAGVDAAIEAAGRPDTFAICQDIVAAGGRIANVGVHGLPVELHLERLWSRNLTLTTRLVDTVATPMLLRMVQAGKLDAKRLVTHTFPLEDAMKAYDTFANAAREGALKVILRRA
jgi:alcohol dehydrogenase